MVGRSSQKVESCCIDAIATLLTRFPQVGHSRPDDERSSRSSARPRLDRSSCMVVRDQVKAGVLVKEAKKGPVSLRVTVSPAKPRLSDFVMLTLEIESELDVEVTIPSFGQSVGEFQIADYKEGQPQLVEGKNVRRVTYELEPMHAGKHLIHSVEVRFVDRREESEAKDKSVTLASEPIEVDVTSEFAKGPPDLAELAPMKEPEALPSPPVPWETWALLATVLSLGIVALVMVRKRRVESGRLEPRRSPEEIAYAELASLKEARLPEQGEVVEFYVRLTGVVRRYVERVSGIHAPDQTTEEFLRAMQKDKRFEPQRAERLTRFLEASDMVKYAAQRPAENEIEDAFERAQEFVGLSGGQGVLAVENTPVRSKQRTES